MAHDPLAIIACGGRVALECIEQVRTAGRAATVIALDGESIAEVTAHADHVLKWGQIGQLVKALERSGARDVLLIGSISRRPDFRALLGDMETIRWLPRLITTMAGGDDSVLRKVVGFFESNGYRIVSIAEVAPDLLAPAGDLTRRAASAAQLKDVQLGFAVLAALGPFDVGQSVVVGDGRVAAIEAAEGTDAMVERVGEIRGKRRVAWGERTGVLVKAPKPDQDLRVDLPVIGPQTVELCAAAGLAGIAVETGRVVVAERDEVVRAAERHGLFVMSLAVEEGA